MGSCRMPQLAQRLVLDLADALASHVKGPTDLFEGVLGTITDAEAQFQNLFFARGQRFEDVFGVVLQGAHDHGFDGRDRVGVLDEVTEV